MSWNDYIKIIHLEKISFIPCQSVLEESRREKGRLEEKSYYILREAPSHEVRLTS